MWWVLGGTEAPPLHPGQQAPPRCIGEWGRWEGSLVISSMSPTCPHTGPSSQAGGLLGGLLPTRCQAVWMLCHWHLLQPHLRVRLIFLPPGRGCAGCPSLTGALLPQPTSQGRQAGIPPPTVQRVWSDHCVPGLRWGLGPWDQMWALPFGGPHLGVGQKRQSRPGGQSISVLISQALGKGWAQNGPPGSLGLGGALGHSCQGPGRGQPPLAEPSRAGPQVAWSLLPVLTACGASPEPPP